MLANTAANLVPSDDEAMDAQYALGALACVHVRPELAEVEM